MTKVEGCLKGKRVSEVCKNHKSVKKDKKTYAKKWTFNLRGGILTPVIPPWLAKCLMCYKKSPGPHTAKQNVKIKLLRLRGHKIWNITPY